MIFFSGQFYDAFAWVKDTIAKAKSSIIIIDNYADKSVLDMLTDKRSSVKNVTIITSNPGNIKTQAQQKWTAQYGNLDVIDSKDFHDRFIILDNKEVYAVGASLKDLGKKCFAISKSEDLGKVFVKHVQEVIAAHRSEAS
jgi:hypothetical protein